MTGRGGQRPGRQPPASRRAGRALPGIALLVLLLAGGTAQARLALSATRVVIDGSGREGGISVRNAGASPTLVQAWVDDGHAERSPEQLATPFQLVPPLLRIDAGGSRRLRVMVIQPDALPADRESLYWLNVVEVPRTAAVEGDATADGGAGELRVVVRTRLKLIHRPATVTGEAADAIRQLDWRLSPDGRLLSVHNPSPRVTSLSQVRAEGAGTVDIGDGVVLPGATRQFVLPAGGSELGALALEWIDDHGTPAWASAALSR